MSKIVELYYDFSSPNAYFAALMLPAIAERTSATIEYRPFFLGGLFKLLDVSQTPGMTSPEKSAASLLDLQRWSQKHRIPFRFPSRFPMNTLLSLRIALSSQELGLAHRAWAEAVFDAYWVQDRDIADEAVLGELLSKLGADPKVALERARGPEAKAALKASTEAARTRGIFGAPACIVGDDLFFGKDRLDFVEDALRALP